MRNHLNEKGLIEVIVSGGENSDDDFYKKHSKIQYYKHGVVQPGVLCVSSEGQKIYAWAINPNTVSWVHPSMARGCPVQDSAVCHWPREKRS